MLYFICLLDVMFKCSMALLQGAMGFVLQCVIVAFPGLTHLLLDNPQINGMVI